jgi:hypothetical protein
MNVKEKSARQALHATDVDARTDAARGAQEIEGRLRAILV